MGQLLLICLLTGLSIVQASIFCPHTAYPSTVNSDEFVVASIQTRQRPTQEAYYRITDDTSDPAFQRNSSRFRLMTTRDSTECPFRGCLVELSPVEPKNHATLLYQTSLIGKMVPPGFFAMDVSRRLYCVVTDSDCGATIPLYRHYRLTPTGIYHAYSLEADEIIQGYTREPTPLCYVWPKEKPQLPAADAPSTLLPPLTDIFEKLLPKPLTTPSSKPSESSHSNEDNALIDTDDLCEEADKKAFDSSMKKLKEYHNGEMGAKSDHWYSTHKPKGAYKPKALMGKVIVDPKSTNCKCLVQLSQMKFESADKNVLDHKLVRVQMEPLSLYQYMPTGEEIYCAQREGACGATIPLRKFYNLADSDSTMTAGSDQAPLNSGPAPSDVLCWIWKKNYHQDSTEEELRKENMNVIQPSKSGEESMEVIDGSGAEPLKSEKSIKAEDEPKPKTAPKKGKNKSKKHGGKKSKSPAESSEKENTTKAPKIESTTLRIESTTQKEASIEEEQLGDQILRFETVDDSVKKISSIFAPSESMEKSEEKAAKSEDKSLLDEDEEKVKELAKFQNNKRGGKEPTEIEEQHDEDSTVLHFEDIAQ